MRLFEYEAKRIFEAQGIPVHRGVLASSLEQIRDLSAQFNVPVVLKPQTLSKQRYKSKLPF